MNPDTSGYRTEAAHNPKNLSLDSAIVEREGYLQSLR
jgi:hypothetical protein